MTKCAPQPGMRFARTVSFVDLATKPGVQSGPLLVRTGARQPRSGSLALIDQFFKRLAFTEAPVFDPGLSF